MYNKTTANNSTPGFTLVRFLVIAFVLGCVTQVLALRAGASRASLLLLTMWTPTIAALTAGTTTRRLVWRALKKISFVWLAVGLLVGLAPGLLKASLLGCGLGHWDSAHFELAPDGAAVKAVHHLAVVLGPGPQSFGYFSLNLFLSLVVGSLVVGVTGGVGEELSWRIVLQPGLEERFGRVNGTCFVGLIWAYWHLPVNLSGYNDAGHPVWNALLFFPLGVVALSFSLAWLTRRTGSVWPAALAHGANNTIGSGFIMVANGWSGETITELTSLWIIGGFFLWRSWRSRDDCNSPTV